MKGPQKFFVIMLFWNIFFLVTFIWELVEILFGLLQQILPELLQQFIFYDSCFCNFFCNLIRNSYDNFFRNFSRYTFNVFSGRLLREIVGNFINNPFKIFISNPIWFSLRNSSHIYSKFFRKFLFRLITIFQSFLR